MGYGFNPIVWPSKNFRKPRNLPPRPSPPHWFDGRTFRPDFDYDIYTFPLFLTDHICLLQRRMPVLVVRERDACCFATNFPKLKLSENTEAKEMIY